MLSSRSNRLMESRLNGADDTFDSETSIIGLTIRPLRLQDLEDVKSVYNQLFPIDYTDEWFANICTLPRYFTLAACVNGNLVGLLVAELRHHQRINFEDDGLLGYWFPDSSAVAYILSLGVVERYRRHRLATTLLNRLLHHSTSGERVETIRCVYLHTMSDNRAAISFYYRHGFRRHRFLRDYYHINQKMEDGICFVRYVNGVMPPMSCWDVFSYVASRCCSPAMCMSGLMRCVRTTLRIVTWTRDPPSWKELPAHKLSA